MGVVEDSGIPFTTLRATQFHELLLIAISALTRPPVAPVFAGTSFQPVAAAEVADRLVELAGAGPGGTRRTWPVPRRCRWRTSSASTSR